MSTFAPGSAHLTCRALVIDRERRVLRLRDSAGGPPVIPGARAEAGDRTLLEVALRAVTEQTRLTPADLCLTPDLLTTPAHVESLGPTHYEFTFALYLAHEPREPLPDIEWTPLDRLDRTLEGVLRRELAEEVPGLEPADLERYAVKEAIGADGRCVPVHVVPRHASRPAPPAPVIPRPAKAPDAGGTELNIVGVHLYAEDEEGRVLLGLRHPDAAFAGDTWHFLAGHCERESAVACLVREAYEEAGLLIDPGDVELAHVVHVLHGPSARPRLQLVFRARRWQGTPWLREPDKCLDWRWWDPDRLPEPLVPYARAAIDGIRTGRAYSEMGWCPA
ncbi:NUDIX domain-containing protein [Streptomyces sp. NPDC090023]|uniref:NUDIX hydrolase n=1 Tax=unclassified Streptomyces TaxID=2593676 RepID=UPI00382EF6CC